MRSRALAVLAAVLAAAPSLTLAACGGDSSSGDVAPKSTPTLTVPAGADALAAEGDGGSSTTGTTSTTDTTDTTTDPTATQAPSAAPTPTQAPAPTQTQAPPASTAGGASPQAEEPEGSDTTGNGGGTGGAGDFNQFCQDNPGACPGN